MVKKYLIILSFLLGVVFLPQKVFANTTPFRSAGWVGTDTWRTFPYINLSGCQATDGIYCSYLLNPGQQNLYFSSFGTLADFGIPQGSTITKIHIKVTGKNTVTQWVQIGHGKNLPLQYLCQNPFDLWQVYLGPTGSVKQLDTSFDSANLLATCFSATQIDNQDFTMSLFFNGYNVNQWSADIDNFEIAFDYTPGPTPTPTNTPTPTPTPKTPVIFIPGIMGSDFEVKQTFDPQIANCLLPNSNYQYNSGDLVWFDISKTAFYSCGNYLDVLGLQSDGQISLYSEIGLKGTLLSIPYDDTLAFLEKNYTFGKNLFVFPYDWRKDVTANMTALNALVDSALQHSGALKVDIIAHSMGGLVARDYISDQSHANKVDKLVELGTPHAGAPEALANLLYSICVRFLDSICVVNGNEINKLVQNFPAAFELLPSKKYYELYSNTSEYPFSDDRDIDNNGYIGPLDYDHLKTLLTNLGKNMTIFGTAESFHDNLDPTYSDTNGVTTYLIAGSGQPTISQIHEYNGFEVFGTRITTGSDPKVDADTTNGDDTVPLKSATLGQTTSVFYTNQKHIDLAKNGPALQMAVNLLQGITDPNSVSGNTVRTTPFDFTGKIVSVHSPVQINAYDDQNRHTGVNPDGTIEENIPGSAYEELGDSKFISLPAGGHYTIKTNATDQGSFDLKIKDYTDNDLTAEQLYLGVEQTSQTQTSANLDEDEPVLHVDMDGDGVADKDISATADLSGDNLLDTAPPATTATLNGTIGQNGIYTSDVNVTLNATDQGTGVSHTYYYKDGDAYASLYTNPITISTEGQTKLWYFSVDNAGNVEGQKSVVFSIDETPPEAKIQFDTQAQDITILGKDNLGATTISQVSTGTNTGQVTVTDKAGNTLILSDIDRQHGQNAVLSVVSAAYNNTVVNTDTNKLTIKYHLDKTYNIKMFDQVYEQKGVVKVNLNYDPNTNKTMITENGVNTTVNGIKILQLKTQNGTLRYSY